MGRKSKAEERRREILENCYRVMSAKGLEGVTLKRIGKQMGVAPSLLMHYFGSKDEMIISVVDYLVEQMDRSYLPQLQELETAKERLAFYFDITLNFNVASTVDDKVFYGCFYLSMQNEQIRNSFRQMYIHDENIAVKLIQEYLEENHVSGVDAETLAIQITAIIEGFYYYRVIFGEREGLEKAIEETKHMLWKVLETT